MKVLEKIILIAYSYIILVVSAILSLEIFGLIDIDLINGIHEKVILAQIPSRILLVINIIFILLSIKCIFFTSSETKSKKDKQGILLQNENGKLLISKETIENLTTSVIRQFESIEQTSTKTIIDKENNIIIMVNLVVDQNIVIKELSNNLQTKIKETLKNALDLEIKEVNIKVKNFVEKNDKTIE